MSGPPPAISLIMPTIDWGPTFQRCVQAAAKGLGEADQLLVVFDGTPPPPPEGLIPARAILLETETRQGPAAARNLAAKQAHGPILFFVDADVELHADAVDRVRAKFSTDPGLGAVFGSYDAHPAAPGLVSRFRNLLHHYTHTSHPGPASTFWAGCGAVRRDPFLALGGFDPQAYPQPSIEDIDFGLRLHASGGRILLDPAIQGTHHKCWDLALMLHTDTQKRAIPWSKLLLKQSAPNASLNLDPMAKLSSLLVLLTLLGLGVIPFYPSLWPFPLVSLGLLAALNRGFYTLCFQQGGLRLALAAFGLHALYFFYSVLCFGWVFLEQTLIPLKRSLQWVLLALLLITTIYFLLHGLTAGLRHPAADLITRFREYAVYREGLYPMRILVPHPVPKSFPYTVYPPYALPMFAVFFGIGGMAQAWGVVIALSIVSLALFAWIGWRTLRFAGLTPALLGALAPVAISGNSYSLFQGQFSLLCMGLISLQWLLLNRQKPRAAGLCWAAAMLKPQIALAFVLPLLWRSNRKGLLIGLAALLGLGAVALVHTNVSPLRYVEVWLQPERFSFAQAGTKNLMNLLGPGTAAFLLLLLIGVLAIGLLTKKTTFSGSPRSDFAASLTKLFDGKTPTLRLQALCGVVGSVVFYHHPYDNIMLYPALLDIFGLALRDHRIWLKLLATAMAIALWAPLHWVANNPTFQSFSTIVSVLVGLTLLAQTSGSTTKSPMEA
ncbi:MAG: glycosyltransferase 87 family protein [Cyanobacteriota bacterium]|jgi:hypothetical protein